MSIVFSADQMDIVPNTGAPLIQDPKHSTISVRLFNKGMESVRLPATKPGELNKVVISLTVRADAPITCAFLINAVVAAKRGAQTFIPLGIADTEATRAFIAAWALTGHWPDNIPVPETAVIAADKVWSWNSFGPFDISDMRLLTAFDITHIPPAGSWGSSMFMRDVRIEFLK